MFFTRFVIELLQPALTMVLILNARVVDEELCIRRILFIVPLLLLLAVIKYMMVIFEIERLVQEQLFQHHLLISLVVLVK
jgi:hypothetical protein